jgi:hypothetical protein
MEWRLADQEPFWTQRAALYPDGIPRRSGEFDSAPRPGHARLNGTYLSDCGIYVFRSLCAERYPR